MLSVIILAYTNSKEIYQMTSDCIESLVASESVPLEIILVESNRDYKNSEYLYPDFVKVIIPQEAFNFHRYLNIGIKACKGNYIALCNNDLIFHTNWFTEIKKVSEKHPQILSFSPSGSANEEKSCTEFVAGYRVMQQIMGWCIVVKREIFKKIGSLDETFDFYYADNDYSLTLRYYNVEHVLVCNSFVEHLGQQSVTKRKNDDKEKQRLAYKYKIPTYLNQPKYEWLFDNEKYLNGILKYHEKWGSPGWIYRKVKISDIISKFGLGSLTKLFLKIKI